MSQPASVLIVDDEPHVRSYVKMLVMATIQDVTIHEAGDGAAALALYSEHRPQLVLLDINLIGTSGLEVLESIMAMDPNAVVAMLTAVNVRHTVESALAKGARGYILKESNFDEMASSLSEVIRDAYPQES